jgi:hypothetical protein
MEHNDEKIPPKMDDLFSTRYAHGIPINNIFGDTN